MKTKLRSFATGMAVTAVSLLAWGSVSQAITINVKNKSDIVGSPQCKKDDTSYCSLRDAIILSNTLPGTDTIVIPSGTYPIQRVGNAWSSDASFGDFDITDSVVIKGSFSVIDGKKIDRIFDIRGSAQSVTLEKLILTGGKPKKGGGGAIYANDGANTSQLTIQNSFITSNVAEEALANGGGLFFRGGDLKIQDSIIYQNMVYSYGGGLYVQAKTSSITGTTLQDNLSGFGAGGGLYLYGGASVLEESEIIHNVIQAPEGPFDGSGGGVYVQNSNLDVFRSTFERNYAPVQGGAIFNRDSNLTLTNSTLSGNKIGNGLEVAFSKGSAISIAAPKAQQYATDLFNVTIANNEAPSNNPAVYNHDGDLQLSGTVFGLPKAGTDCGKGIGADILSSGGNISFAAGCGLQPGIDLQNVDPLLGTLVSNGGGTRTHALLQGSPAIDFMQDSILVPDTDQRGILRDSQPDSGAYEYTGEKGN